MRAALWTAEIVAGPPHDVPSHVATLAVHEAAAADRRVPPTRMRCVGLDMASVRRLDSGHSDPISGLRAFLEAPAPARISEMTAFSIKASHAPFALRR